MIYSSVTESRNGLGQFVKWIISDISELLQDCQFKNLKVILNSLFFLNDLKFCFFFFKNLQLCPPCKAEAEVFSCSTNYRLEQSFEAPHCHPRKLDTGSPQVFGDSKTKPIDLLSLNLCQSPMSPWQWGWFCTLTTSWN